MAKQIVIVGAGPAGIEAARTAAKAGAHVTLVSDTPVGGRAGWHSLVPSKVWLNAADVMGTIADAAAQGVDVGDARVNASAVLARIQAVAAQWNGRLVAELDALGVTTRTGVAAFAGPHAVELTTDSQTETLTADAVIIAGGSVPVFPEGMRPDGQRILAPRFAPKLAQLPASTVVVGAGATGVEFVYLFNRLGVEVTWVVDPFGVLPQFDRDAAAALTATFARRGVNIVSGQFAQGIDADDHGVTVTLEDGTALRAEGAFLAIGRRADLSRLHVDAAGLSVGERGGALLVDAFCRTTVPGVYAVGDAAGAPMLANQAVRQAQVAARHAAGAPTLPYRPDTTVHAVYSDPQVAQVGVVNDPGDIHVRVPFAAGLKAHLGHDDGGFLTLYYSPTTRVVRGAVAVGHHAAEALAPVAMAVQTGATVEQLAAPAPAYPTVSEFAFLAAQAAT